LSKANKMPSAQIETKLRIAICFLTFLLGGCTALPPTQNQIFERQYTAEEISEINVDLQAGQINLVGGDSTEIILNASLANLDSIIEEHQDTILNLTFPESEIGDVITFQVPLGVVLNINTFSAGVTVIDFFGQVDISSVAGDVVLDAFTGDALLWAGRGDVDILYGQGDVVVIGEHGTLSVSGFDGDVSMTTIMGTLKFLGAESANGSAFLESDHGPVEVLLPETANFDIQVNTTSGYVTCLGSELSQTVSGCEGIIGEGTESLAVRTVSGRVDLKVISAEPQED
jgi:DUF4097 and DUF4098 domain-containing protein YvlB